MKTLAHQFGTLLLVALALAGTLCQPAGAQELVPRAYWPAPLGTNVASLSYQHSSGDIVTDPSLPVTGVDSRIHVAQLGYQRTFGLFGRTSSLQVAVPYSWAHTEGTYLGQPVARVVDGFADARLRFAINLAGAPAMDRQAFRSLAANPVTQAGFSLTIQAPTGQYDGSRLVNLGANRWAAKPAFGVIYPFAESWMLEFELGCWLFGDNNDFLGQTRSQAPIGSGAAHLVRRFDSGLWASLDANYYTGGRTQVGADRKKDLQRNSRFGATLVVPVHGGHALRATYSTGVVTESGGDFDMYSLSYLYVW